MKKILVALLSLAFIGPASADQNFTSFPFAVTGGTATRTDPARWADQGCNVLELGADPTNSADSTAAFQSCFDNIYSTASRTVTCPAGTYKISLPLFMDAPGNLRGGAKTYSAGTTYAQYDVVTSSGIVYTSLQNTNLNHTPASSPTFWRVFAYSAGTTYALNDVVSSGGIPWKSLGNSNTGNTPGITSTHWTPTTVGPADVLSAGFTLIGQPGLGGNLSKGCTLQFTYNNGPGLIVGSGNGQLVQSVNIIGTVASAPRNYRCGQSQYGIGVVVSGGSGGSSRFKIENSYINNWSIGVLTGYNQAALGDSNSIVKTDIDTNTCIGVYYAATQNFINDIVASNIAGNNPIYSPVGTRVAVFGGNYSSQSAVSAFFTISSVSAVNSSGVFNATISSPDIYLGADCAASLAETPLRPCVYTAYTFETTSFGVVPATMTAFNSGTNVATFTLLPNWLSSYFNAVNIATDTALGTELTAATKVYASEMPTTFKGSGITVHSVHVENNSAPTTYVYGLQSSGGINLTNSIEDMYVQGDMGLDAEWASSAKDDAAKAWYYAAQLHPSFYVGAADLELNRLLGASNGSIQGRFLVDVTDTSKVFHWRGNTVPFNIRVANNGRTFTGDFAPGGSAGIGGGDYDKSAFYPYFSNATGLSFPAQWPIQWGRAPQWGFRPAPWASPCLTPAQITTLKGALPAISYAGGGYTIAYPLMWSGQTYRKCDWTMTGQTTFTAVSQHGVGYTFGQDLTTTNVPNLAWHYKGQSFVLYVNTEMAQLAFPGWGFNINNGGGSLPYMTTGVYANMPSPWITVQASTANSSPSTLAGTKTVTYNCPSDCPATKILQSAFTITEY